MNHHFGAGRGNAYSSSDDSSLEAVVLPKLENPNDKPPRWPNIPFRIAAAMEEPEPEQNQSGSETRAEKVAVVPPIQQSDAQAYVALKDRTVLLLDGAPRSSGAYSEVRYQVGSILERLGLTRLANSISKRTLIEIEGPVSFDGRSMVGIRWNTDHGTPRSRLCRSMDPVHLSAGECTVVELVGNRIYESDRSPGNCHTLNAVASTEKIARRVGV